MISARVDRLDGPGALWELDGALEPDASEK